MANIRRERYLSTINPAAVGRRLPIMRKNCRLPMRARERTWEVLLPLVAVQSLLARIWRRLALIRSKVRPTYLLNEANTNNVRQQERRGYPIRAAAVFAKGMNRPKGWIRKTISGRAQGCAPIAASCGWRSQIGGPLFFYASAPCPTRLTLSIRAFLCWSARVTNQIAKTHLKSMVRSSSRRRVFHFEEQKADVTLANVFHGVRCQRLRPVRHVILPGSGLFSSVQQYLAIRVASNKVRPTQDVGDAAPAVRMQRHDGPRRNFRVKHPYARIFQQKRMMIGRSDEGVEGIRPRPCLKSCLTRGAHRDPDAA